MTGYSSLFIAIKPTNGGNYAVKAVMGPDSVSFANLNPVNAAATIQIFCETADEEDAVNSTVSMTADVWNILLIEKRLMQQKLLQFSITNNSGGSSDIETAFMRVV